MGEEEKNRKQKEEHKKETGRWWLGLGEYDRSLEMKGVEWDGENNVEHMWEQVKWVKFKVQEKCVAQWE